MFYIFIKFILNLRNKNILKIFLYPYSLVIFKFVVTIK